MNHEVIDFLQYCSLAFSFLFLILVFIRFRAFFWGKLLTAYLALSVLTGLAVRIGTFLWKSEMLEFETVKLFIYDSTSMLWLYEQVLLILAIASIPIGRTAPQPPEQLCSPASLPKDMPQMGRSPWVTMLWLPFSLNIHYWFWLYRTVKDLKQLAPERIKFSPGKAVGFCFIPIFQVFWIIYIWVVMTRTLTRLHDSYSDWRRDAAFSSAGVLILWLGIGITANLIPFEPILALSFELILLTLLGYTQHFMNGIRLGILAVQNKEDNKVDGSSSVSGGA